MDEKGHGLFDVTWDALMALRSASLLEQLSLRLCPRKFPPVILDSTEMTGLELFGTFRDPRLTGSGRTSCGF